MGDAPPPVDDEVETAGSSPPVLALVYVGSPEDGFRDAGFVLPLPSVRRVLFGRAEGSKLEISERRDSLHVGIPLAWVSGRHAELLVGQAWRGDDVRLRDHASRNGTLLEGAPLLGDATVQPGRIFEVGRSFWVLVELPARDDEDAVRRLLPEGTASPRMRHVVRALSRLADKGVPVLLTGETGVGKDRLANAMHSLGGADRPFVPANLSAGSVDQVLLTAAGDGESSLLAKARGGTLYLDEVGELELEDQTKLVSLLMSHTPRDWAATPAGDARVIAASTRDLRGMVSRQAFRPDLMARLAGFEAALPALRDRREDLGRLVRELSVRDDGTTVPITTDVFRAMLSYSWPFNIRELEHSLRAAAAIAHPERGITSAAWRRVVWSTDGLPEDPARIQSVREALVHHLAAHAGDTHAVARSMHCEQRDIERWLDRLELRPEEYSRAG